MNNSNRILSWQRKNLKTSRRFGLPTPLRILSVYFVVTLEFILDWISKFKIIFVSRMFWGRSNLYRGVFHYFIATISICILSLGVLNQVFITSAQEESLTNISGVPVSSDLLQQGSSISTVLAVNPYQPAVNVQEYEVQPGDNLLTVSTKFQINPDTIRWANQEIVSPFANDLQVGWKIRIPEIDGIFISVKPGETVDTIANNFGDSVHRTDVIELNRLDPQDPSLKSGQKLFIANGKLKNSELYANLDIPVGVFTNPLGSADCAGYVLSRGVTSGHTGVDLAKYPGCTVTAIATGDVIAAGDGGLAGLHVKINHGGGIISTYMHAASLYVKPGDRVQQGQPIMYMGTTGNSTGVHLHLEIRKNGYVIDPFAYVPY